MAERKELLESYAQTPFYQEFTVTFSDESLGLEVQKVHDLPVVRRLLRNTPTWMGQAEKGGVSVGSLLAAVGNAQLTSMPYDDVLKKIKGSSRPIALTFRRLHAISDPGVCIGRLWQGFLRTWTGKDSGHWTGRFYLLCANGDLQAFVGTDPESMSQPVDQFSVVGCPVLWGREAKQKAIEHGLMLGSDWEDIFAIQPPDLDNAIPLFFRATCSDSRSEWVGALSTLEVSLTVSVESSANSALEDESSRELLKEGKLTGKQRSNSIDPLAYWPPLTVLKHGLAEKGDKSVFSSDLSGRQGVMGNLLASAPKWRAICLLLLPGKPNSTGEVTHPRLCWYHKAPSNANELPSGQVLLWGVRLANLSEDQRIKSEPSAVSSKTNGQGSKDETNNQSSSEVSGISGDVSNDGNVSGDDGGGGDGVFKLDHGALGFILYAANRLIRLRFHYEAECQEWARVLMAVSDTSDTFISSSNMTGGTSASNGYESRLVSYQETCENVLRGCDAVIPLLAGGAYRLAETLVKKSSTSIPTSPTIKARAPTTKKKYSISLSTAILRRDFNTVAAQYLLPLCDCFTSDIIFEALTEDCRISSSSQSSHLSRKSKKITNLSPSKSQSIAIQAGKLLGDLAGSVGGDKRKFDLLENGDRLLRSISATPLDMGISLPHKTLKQYCAVLDIVTRMDESWEVLRMKIGLEPSEILVRVDEKVTCGGEEVMFQNVNSFTETEAEASSSSSLSNFDASLSRGRNEDEGNECSSEVQPSAPSDSKQNTQDESTSTAKKSKKECRAKVEWMEIGTLYITDRNIVFLRKGRLTTYRGFETTSGSRPVARIIPLSQLQQQVLDRGRAGLLLPNAFLVTAHLDDQIVTEEKVSVSLNFSSCRSSSMFATSEFGMGEELKAIGGGRIRALQRIMKETLSELIAAHHIMNYSASSLSSSSSSSCSSSNAALSPQPFVVVSSQTLLKTSAYRRRGVSAMIETIKTALKLGPKEVWSRGCGAELSESELWLLEVQTHALSMWVALNLKRRSALMRVTGLTLSALLVCTKYLEYYSENGGNHFNDLRLNQARDSVQHFLEDLNLWVLNQKTSRMENSDWLLHAAKWLTHQKSRIQRALIPIEKAKLLKGTPSFEGNGKKREEAMKLRAAYSEAFNPTDFRDNWQLFMSYLDPFVDNFVDVLPGTVTHSLLHWNDPFISFGVMTALLAIAYHDLVYLFPSLCLLSYALFLLISGSSIAANASEEAIQNEIRKESTRKLLLSSTPPSLVPSSEPNLVLNRHGVSEQGAVPITPTSPFLTTSRFSSRSQSTSMKESATCEPASPRSGHSSTSQQNTSTSGSNSTVGGEDDSRNGGGGGGGAQISFKTPSESSSSKPMGNHQTTSGLESEMGADLDDDQVMAIAAAAAARSRTLTSSSSMRETSAADMIRDRFQSVTSALTAATTPIPTPTSSKESDKQIGSGIPSLSLAAARTLSGMSTPAGLSAPPLEKDFHDSDRDSSGEEDVEDDELKEIAQNVVAASPLPNTQEVTDEKDEKEGLVEFMRQMRAHLGRMQLHLHRYNKYYLRWQALHMWRDPASSWILFFVLFLSATWLAVVPHNISFGMATIYAFARPIRKPKVSKGLLSIFDAMLYQWLDGIPLDAPTHRSASSAVQMALVKNKLV